MTWLKNQNQNFPQGSELKKRSSSPLKQNEHGLSDEVVENYKNVGVSELVLNELNVQPTDTVTTGDRNFRHFNRQVAALDLAGVDSGIVQLYKSPGEEVETEIVKKGKKTKEKIVPFFGDKIYTKDDKEKLASTVTIKN